MAVPDFQSILLPLLKLSADGKEHTVPETEEKLADILNLTKEDREEMLPSGTQRRFVNRLAWTKVHLSKAGLIMSPRRSVYKITQRGLDALKENPDKINMGYLKQFEEYREFIKPTKGKDNADSDIGPLAESLTTPRETLENAYQVLRKELVQDILEKVKQATPRYFEEIVVELLVRMGYGGTVKDAGQATQYTNDEGVDGVIKEDKLGLDVIYIQAKRYKDIAIGRPEIQAFVGALDGKHANKGIFLTTSRFADTAFAYVKSISKKVVLIDGEQLANYMIDYNLGVSTTAVFELKKIDNDYFGE
jgi:restriction system protein